jgi:thiamine transporter ThiT
MNLLRSFNFASCTGFLVGRLFFVIITFLLSRFQMVRELILDLFAVVFFGWWAHNVGGN